jgi:hypothetical protein
MRLFRRDAVNRVAPGKTVKPDGRVLSGALGGLISAQPKCGLLERNGLMAADSKSVSSYRTIGCPRFGRLNHVQTDGHRFFPAETDQSPVAATDNGRALRSSKSMITSQGHWPTGSLAPG